MLHQESAFAHAAWWLAAILTGSVGTTIAVLAIAATGLAMLWGRLAVRDGVRGVIGCFVLFGAPAIAQGLMGLSDAAPGEAASAEIYSAPAAPPAVPKPPEPNRDPYAGASVPM